MIGSLAHKTSSALKTNIGSLWKRRTTEGKTLLPHPGPSPLLTYSKIRHSPELLRPALSINAREVVSE
jgi:hypothetical protein